MDLAALVIFAFAAPALGLVMLLVVGWGMWRYPKQDRPSWIIGVAMTACLLLGAGALAFFQLSQINFSY